MEAEVGIEPTNGAFAEPCLTTWLLRHSKSGHFKEAWCGGASMFAGIWTNTCQQGFWSVAVL